MDVVPCLEQLLSRSAGGNTFSGRWIMRTSVVPSPFECYSYARENSLYSKCSCGSGNQHCFPCRGSAGARGGTWISWQGSLGLFTEKSLCLAGGGASQAPLWEMPCGNSVWWGAELWLWLQLSLGTNFAVSAAELLLGAGLSLVLWKLQSLERALSVSSKVLLGEKDSPAPDKCSWGSAYSPNELDTVTFRVTPKPEWQQLCFHLKWCEWRPIMPHGKLSCFSFSGNISSCWPWIVTI